MPTKPPHRLTNVVLSCLVGLFSLGFGFKPPEAVWSPTTVAAESAITYGDLYDWNLAHRVAWTIGNNVWVPKPFLPGDNRDGTRFVARYAPEKVDEPLTRGTQLVLLNIHYFSWTDLTRLHDEALFRSATASTSLQPPASSPANAFYPILFLVLATAVFLLGRFTKRQSIIYTYQPDDTTARMNAEFSARLHDATTSLEDYRDRLRGRLR